jgi:phospholipid/cholesterol/gamma-HCH transport system substrate-binding protein
MENRSHSFIAGLFVLLLGFFGVLGAIWLQGPKPPSRVPVDLVTSHSVAGLRPDASVRYRGVDVGQVESIAFDKRTLGQIRVRIGIDPATPLTRSTYAKLGFQGINGVAIIQLDSAHREDPPLALTGNDVPELELQAGLLEIAEANAQDVLLKVGAVATRLESLLSEDNTHRVMLLVDTLQQATSRYSTLARDLAPTATAFPGLVQNASLTLMEAQTAARRLAQVAADADQHMAVLDAATAATLQVGRAADDLHRDTLPRVNALVEELSTDSRELQYTLHQINARPQSLLFGAAPAPPGPGEKGFVSKRQALP